MYYGIFILMRLLFVASMVFIVGYVFGQFSGKPVLRTVTKVAVILTIVLFFFGNIFFFRSGGWHYGNFHHRDDCGYTQSDTVRNK